MTRAKSHIQSEPTAHQTNTLHTTNRPKVGLTMGDATGIGPEIIVKALAHKSVYAHCEPIVIGSSAIFYEACSRFTPHGTPPLKLNIIKTPIQAAAKHGTLDLLDVSSISPQDIALGTIDARAGAAAVKAIETGSDLAMRGELDAITTAPICKAAVHRAGVHYPGHTEMLAAFTNTPHVVMMLCTPEALNYQSCTDGNGFVHRRRNEPDSHLSVKKTKGNRSAFAVSFVTNHIALADVSKHLSVERIAAVIRITQETLIRCGISAPRLVVAGLNPHAGEAGIFGKEEAHFISPAIAAAETYACPGTIDGPLPADTLFVRASRGEWHAVIAIYHDQGNIPIKLLGFGELVNVTLGLPIVRTSVDHGTAFDIAGKGIASETSLMAALKCASQLSNLPCG